jgi:amino acid transporter
MSSSDGSRGLTQNGTARRAAQVVVVSSVMFTFISFWRTAAVVLCDLSSTMYYIGAIVENAIGKAAPWFIIAVLLFGYAIRAVYIESCSLFVRGGVYRVVKEALGGFLAKVSVSALLFDFVLTGPISGVSAGQYIVGLVLEGLTRLGGVEVDEGTRQSLKSGGSVAIACGITLYFFRQNILGIPESSGKALKIMVITTVMGVVMLTWSALTLATRGPVNDLPTWQPDLQKKFEAIPSRVLVPKIDPVTGEQQDPLGMLGDFPRLAEPLRSPTDWLSIVGVIGLIIAFGHSILALSGEETLAQVYREVEAPKLPNFKKAAFVIFLYSLMLTGAMNLLTVLLVPDAERMTVYYDNWIGGLAMQMVGPLEVRLLLNAFVVVVGFLVLSGAVNTSIIGSNGVLSRVAEDGVLPTWLLRPHPRYGTNYRILYLITAMQLITIIISRGDVILLGEAYAFGVVWSFVFQTLSMVVLRFKDRTPREFRVPLNVCVRGVEVPIGLLLIFVLIFLAAISNIFTKPVATVSGSIFAGAFLAIFVASDKFHRWRRRGAEHKHIEQFNQTTVEEATATTLALSHPYRKLVAIRSPHNLFMLDKALADTDPETTDVIVMTAKVTPHRTEAITTELDTYDQHLLTAVVNHAEQLGKRVVPLLVPAHHGLHAVLATAQQLGVQELVLGASNVYTAQEQLDQIALYWINLHGGQPQGLTVHIISADRDVTFDLNGGNRIPKVGERGARTAAQLRAAGIGVSRILMAHDGTTDSHDVFDWLLTMLAADVDLDVVAVAPLASEPIAGAEAIQLDAKRAEQLGRKVKLLSLEPQSGPDIVRLAREGNHQVLILPWPEDSPAPTGPTAREWLAYTLRHAPCSVFLVAHPVIPEEVVA